MLLKKRHSVFFILVILALIACGYKIPRKDRHPDIPDFPYAKGSRQIEITRLELSDLEMDKIIRNQAQAKEDRFRRYDFVTLKNSSSGNHFGCWFKPEGISYYSIRMDKEEARFKINETLDRHISAFESQNPDELILFYGYTQWSWQEITPQTDVYLVRNIVQSE